MPHGKMTRWSQLLTCAATEPLQRQQGQLLAGILLGLLGIAAFALLRGFLDSTRPVGVQAIVLGGLVIVSSLYWLNRRGAVTAASTGLVLLGIAGPTGLSLFAIPEQSVSLPAVINPFGLMIAIGIAGVFLPVWVLPWLVLVVSVDTAWIYLVGASSLAVMRIEHPEQITFLTVNAIIIYLLVGFFTGAGSYLRNRALRDAQAANRNMQAAQTQERRRLIRELHDGPLQEIVGIMRLTEQCAILLAEGEIEQARPLVALCSSQAEVVVTQIRTLVRDLRPQELEGTTLAAALDQLVARTQEAGIAVQLHYALIPSLPPPMEVALFRLTQEGLTNIRKHARAQHAWVTLEAQAGTVRLEIRDDGQGFDPAQVAQRPQADHMGLENMVDRVADLDGQLQIASTPGAGTTLQVTLPLPDLAAATAHATRPVRQVL